MAEVNIKISDRRKVSGAQATRATYGSIRADPIKRTPRKPPPPPPQQDDEDDDNDGDDRKFSRSFGITRTLTWINFGLLIVLLTCVIIYLATTTTAHAPLPLQPPQVRITATVSSVIPFTLVPDSKSANRYMTLPLTNVSNMKDVLHFQVCCNVRQFFLCGPVTKNLGVTAYLTTEKTAIIQIIHDDMIGAACKLFWTQ